MKSRSKFGWMEGITAILFLALGILALFIPQPQAHIFFVLCGATLIIRGAADISFFLRFRMVTLFGPTFSVIAGLIDIVFGILLICNTGSLEWNLTVLIPIWFIVNSISRLAGANIVELFSKVAYWFLTILSTVGLLIGFLIIFHPQPPEMAMICYVAPYLLLLGVSGLAGAASKLGAKHEYKY